MKNIYVALYKNDPVYGHNHLPRILGVYSTYESALNSINNKGFTVQVKQRIYSGADDYDYACDGFMYEDETCMNDGVAYITKLPMDQFIELHDDLDTY